MQPDELDWSNKLYVDFKVIYTLEYRTITKCHICFYKHIVCF